MSARRNQPQREGRLDQHPLVEKLVPDPAAPPHPVLLTGYQGRSSKEGSVRIYLSADLSSWVDVSDQDVLHMEGPPGDRPTAPSTIWVRRGATLEHTQAASRQVQAEFLQGAIAQTYLPGARMEAGRVVGPQVGEASVACGDSIVVCTWACGPPREMG